MEICGSTCRQCKKPIVLASDGKICLSCEETTHLDCDSSEYCKTCGSKFRRFERSKADPREGFDPREKRSADSVGPMLAAVLSFLAVLLLYYLWSLA